MNKTVVLVVMDGIGKGCGGCGDAVSMAITPTLDMLLRNYPNIYIKAHGTAVGLPSDDDMGNSEVGHNALGCGQVYSQGAKLVNESIERGDIYRSDSWHEIISDCIRNGSTPFHRAVVRRERPLEHQSSQVDDSAGKKDGVEKSGSMPCWTAATSPPCLPRLTSTTSKRSGRPQRRRLRRHDSFRRRQDGSHDGQVPGRLGHGTARLGNTCAGRRQAVRLSGRSHNDIQGRTGRDRPIPATFHRGKDGQPAGRIVDGTAWYCSTSGATGR